MWENQNAQIMFQLRLLAPILFAYSFHTMAGKSTFWMCLMSNFFMCLSGCSCAIWYHFKDIQRRFLLNKEQPWLKNHVRNLKSACELLLMWVYWILSIPLYVPVLTFELLTYTFQAVKNNRYDDDPILSSCGIKIEKQLTRVDGRVLSAPTVRPHPFILFSPFICDSCSLIILIC